MPLPLVPPRADRTVAFSGWRIAVWCAITLGMTAPGQTAGVSVFIDPMMAGLELSRSQISGAYLVGTLAGAWTMPMFGRLLDRRGTRFTMTAVGATFAVALAAMSGVAGLVTLALGFIGIRMLGQGALSLVSTTAVAHWFDRYRGRAVGWSAAGGQAIMTVMPLALAATITAFGWRSTWVIAAVVVGVVTVTIARFAIHDHPRDLGQHVDGRVPSDDEPTAPAWGVTRPEALRTPMFWAIAGGVIATGLVSTGLSFHQVAILGEQGLTPIEAAANFIPQTAAGLVATIVTGTLVDHVRPRLVLALSMASLVTAMLILPTVAPGVMAYVYGALFGAAGGSARALEASSLPHLFGTLHIGSIRGVAMTLTVLGTAVAPFIISLGHDLSGSYVPVVRWLVVLPVAVVLVGLFADRPDRRSGATESVERHGG